MTMTPRFVSSWAFSLCLTACIALSPSAQAQGPPAPEAKIQFGPLSFGFVTGFYQPDLGTLNSVINNRQLAILEDPNFLLPSNPDFRVESRNIPAGRMTSGPWVALETQYEVSSRFAVRFTGGVWRGERQADDTIVTFLRSNLPQIEVPRTARYNLILDQFFLDWRYYILNDPSLGRISLDLGLVGITLGFLTMDSVVRVVDPILAFASVSSTEARGVAFTTRYGLTGEYHLGNKFSIGLSTHYVIGKIRDLEVTRHFPAGFPQIPVPEPLSIRPGVPLPTTQPTPVEGDTLSHATTVTSNRQEIVGSQRNLQLELDGLAVSGYIRFHF